MARRGARPGSTQPTREPRLLSLAIVSYPSSLEPVFEAIAVRLARDLAPGFAVERCQHPDDVPFLAQRWQRRGYAITRLDLYGHGAGGAFALGDELLFASDGTGYGRARALGPRLAPGAQVRLLGCRTGTVAALPRPGTRRLSGPQLLRDLERLLRRGRTAWGTTGFLRPEHFGARGLADDSPLLRRA